LENFFPVEKFLLKIGRLILELPVLELLESREEFLEQRKLFLRGSYSGLSFPRFGRSLEKGRFLS